MVTTLLYAVSVREYPYTLRSLSSTGPGIEHVGLGSDFDGFIGAPFDTTGIPMLTEALLEIGLTEEDVGSVLGSNVRRVLAANL